ncbi:MAG: TetR/AcrR family transcriptional regulator [Deltaproteobacteria bacterium]|nr:TetR/AcrR family transcriptional regulator [Deltaproteobacteria bacterium]
MASQKDSPRGTPKHGQSQEAAGAGERPRRGRPPRISHESVVAAAVALAESEGPAQLTMARVAAAVGATPMAVYRYIPNREALLADVNEALIEQMDFELPAGVPWQQRVEAWMDTARAHFVARPHAMAQLGSAESSSPAWMRAITPLLETLRDAGFSEESTALGLVWVARLTIGVLVQEVCGSLTEDHLVNSLSSLGKDQMKPWLDLVPAFGELSDESFFEFAKVQAVSGLSALLAKDTRARTAEGR